MAQNVNLDHPWVRGKELLLVKGSFAPNGSSNPSTTTILGGHIKTVVWTSTGKWTVTLRDSGLQALEAWDLSAQLNADNVDHTLSLGAVTNVGAAQNSATNPVTFIIRNAPGGAVADIAANANNRIAFMLLFRRSKLK